MRPKNSSCNGSLTSLMLRIFLILQRKSRNSAYWQLTWSKFYKKIKVCKQLMVWCYILYRLFQLLEDSIHVFFCRIRIALSMHANDRRRLQFIQSRFLERYYWLLFKILIVPQEDLKHPPLQGVVMASVPEWVVSGYLAPLKCTVNV